MSSTDHPTTPVTPTTGPAFPGGTVLGYPRIGRRRELKRAVEAFWAGRTTAAELESAAADLRLATVRRLVELGLDATDGSVPGSFSFYDQVLDVVATLGAVPARFTGLLDESGRLDVAGYSTVARGAGDRGVSGAALEMTKWFDTNYHYLVPEIGPDTPISFVDDRFVAAFVEAKEAGVVTRPVVVGPVTFLALSKAADDAPEGFRPLDRLDDVVAAYADLLRALAAAGAPWVQLDEPALVTDSVDATFAELSAAVTTAYGALATDLAVGTDRPAVLVAAPFGGLRSDAGDGLALLAGTDVDAIAVDLVKGAVPTGAVPGLAGKTLVAGVVDGHNVWRADLAAKLDVVDALAGLGAGGLAVGTSTSLLHVPHDVEDEVFGGPGTPGTVLDPRLRDWLAFADQKVVEVATLARGLAEGRDAVAAELAASAAAVASRTAAAGVVVPAVRERAAALTDADFARGSYADRAAAQAERLDLRRCPRPPSGRSRRPRRSAAPAPCGRRASCPTPTTRRRCARRSPGSCGSRRTSASTSSCTASPSATTWSSTSRSTSTGSRSPRTAGCSPTAPAACARRSCGATCSAPPPSPSSGRRTPRP